MSLSLGVVILAAGASTRMGRPKLLLPWGNTSVLGHLLAQWQSLLANQIAVVCAAGDAAMQAELDRLAVLESNRIFNPNPERGMFSSIQCAARWDGWAKDLTHFVIALGDQPHLRRETLKTLVDFTVGHSDAICRPSRAGRAKHPALLPQTAFTALRETVEPTLKEFLLASPLEKAFVAVDDPGLDLDLDSPNDYAKAQALFTEQVKSPSEKTA